MESLVHASRHCGCNRLVLLQVVVLLYRQYTLNNIETAYTLLVFQPNGPDVQLLEQLETDP